MMKCLELGSVHTIVSTGRNCRSQMLSKITRRQELDLKNDGHRKQPGFLLFQLLFFFFGGKRYNVRE